MINLKNKLISKIHKEFPEVVFKKAKLITEGWDHDVLVLDNKFIFRFAKKKLYKNSFAREVKFLKYFSQISTLLVPNYIFLSKNKTFGGYKMIQGKQLTAKIYNKLPKSKKQKIIQELAKFLTILHNISEKDIKKFEFASYKAMTEDRKWFETEFKPKMTKYLTKSQNLFIKNFIQKFYKKQRKIKYVLGHFDLSHDHILIDKSGNITGIIDFGDMNLSDPAREFNGFENYDSSLNLVKQIYKYYRGPKDPQFLKRCHEHYIHCWIYLLYDGKIRRKAPKLWKEAQREINKIIRT